MMFDISKSVGCTESWESELFEEGFSVIYVCLLPVTRSICDLSRE